MFSFSIKSSDIAKFPMAGNFNPVDHQLLKHQLISGDRYWLIIIGEVLNNVGSVEQAYKLLGNAKSEIAVLEAQYNENGFNFRYIANGNGAIPIYLHQNDEFIALDWDLNRLTRSIKNKTIDTQYICRSLLDPVYSYRTPFQNIQMLPVRTELSWNGKQMQIVSLDAELFCPDYNGSTSDLLIESVQGYFKRFDNRDIKIAAELSGGMDSTFTALMAFKTLACEGTTLGIDIGFGAARKGQLERRQFVIEALGCSDFLVNIKDHMPSFELNCSDIESRYLHSEEYEKAFTSLWDHARNEGCNVLVGGYGGDELFSTFSHEEEKFDRLRGITPADVDQTCKQLKRILTDKAWQAANDGFLGEITGSGLNKFARLSALKRAPLMIQRGFWPLFPYLDETLAHLIKQAPFDDRHEKAALNDAIRTILPSFDLFSDYEKETLIEASDVSFQKNKDHIISTLKSSLLAEMGIINPQSLCKETMGDLTNIHNPSAEILSNLFSANKYLMAAEKHEQI